MLDESTSERLNEDKKKTGNFIIISSFFHIANFIIIAKCEVEVRQAVRLVECLMMNGGRESLMGSTA